MTKKIYSTPAVTETVFHLEGSVLTVSVEFDGSQGADVKFDTESDFDSFFGL